MFFVLFFQDRNTIYQYFFVACNQGSSPRTSMGCLWSVITCGNSHYCGQRRAGPGEKRGRGGRELCRGIDHPLSVFRKQTPLTQIAVMREDIGSFPPSYSTCSRGIRQFIAKSVRFAMNRVVESRHVVSGQLSPRLPPILESIGFILDFYF